MRSIIWSKLPVLGGLIALISGVSGSGIVLAQGAALVSFPPADTGADGPFVAALVAPMSPVGRTSRTVVPPADAPELDALEVDANGAAATSLRQPRRGRYNAGEIFRWDLPTEQDHYRPEERPWPRWVLDGRDLYWESPPEYAAGHLPLFYMSQPRETELGRKLKRLVHEKVFREFRRMVKREWKSLYRESSTMTYKKYEQTLAKINRIGKEDEFDGFNDEYRTNETRDSVFGRERQGEADIPLLTVGPLTLTDAGDIYFDFGSAASEEQMDGVEIGKKESKPLFSSQHYKLNTSLRVHVNPLRYEGGGNHLPMIQSYGIEFEVDWLSDVLKREMITNEFAVEIDSHGEAAAFFNFVISSRK